MDQITFYEPKELCRRDSAFWASRNFVRQFTPGCSTRDRSNTFALKYLFIFNIISAINVY